MEKIKAGVVVVTKFCRSQSSHFSSYINYIDRDEAARTENSSHYNLYQDYMGNPEKTTGLFTAEKNNLTFQEKEELKELFQTAQDNDSLMWQTVISFDNRFLAENGLYQEEEQILDEDALKNMVRNAVGKMLKAEDLENAVWSAAIHFNTDNIHVHIATVEPDPMREKREYIQYEEKTIDGKTVKVPMRDADGKIIKQEEYKGTFRPKSIEACKRSVVNEILHEKENNLKINQVIRDSIVKQAGLHPLSQDKDLAHAFLNLYDKMPDTARNLWNYNNPVMVPLQPEIDQLANMYLEKYHKEEFAELKTMLQEQDQKYQQAYGNNNRNYTDGKMQDLYTRLGNAILKEIRTYDKDIKQSAKNKARFWYQKEGDNDNKFASYRLGKKEYQEKNYASAVTHLEKCNNKYSDYLLGKIFLDPDSGMQDIRKGIFYMTKSADAGNSNAELSLGVLFLQGKIVDRDLEEAKKWLARSASHGNEYAQNILDNPFKQSVRSGVSLMSAINRMKKGLENEWQRRQNIREHDQMVEQAVSRSAGQEEDK